MQFMSIFLSKYGEKKLKWTVVIPLLIVSRTVHIAAAIVPSFDEFGSMNNNGFVRPIQTPSCTRVSLVLLLV